MRQKRAGIENAGSGRTNGILLSAGRPQMSEALQGLCFPAGANSIFYGDKLLTTANPDVERERALMDNLGISAQPGIAD